MKTLACVLALTMLASRSAGYDQMEKVPLDQLPKAVMDSLKQRFPKADMIRAGRVVEKGKTKYVVGLKDGVRIGVSISPEGKITRLEKEMLVKGLPKVVLDALDERSPKAALKAAKEIIEVANGKEVLGSYEVVLVAANTTRLEAAISPQGKIIRFDAVNREEDKDD